MILRRPGIPLRLDEQTTMLLVAVAIGVLGGLGAFFFRLLIGAIENLAWGAEGSSLEKFARSATSPAAGSRWSPGLPPHLDSVRRITIAEDIMARPTLSVRDDDTLDYAMHQLGKANSEELPVLPPGTSWAATSWPKWMRPPASAISP